MAAVLAQSSFSQLQRLVCNLLHCANALRVSEMQWQQDEMLAEQLTERELVSMQVLNDRRQLVDQQSQPLLLRCYILHDLCLHIKAPAVRHALCHSVWGPPKLVMACPMPAVT